MKKSELFFAALAVPVDFIMIIAAGAAAYVLRFQTLADVRPVIYQLPIQSYIVITIIMACSSIVIFALSGLYAIRRWKMQNEIQRIAIAVSASVMIFIVVIFFRQEYFSSRFVILALWILTICFVSIGRSFIRFVRSLCYMHRIGLHSIALLGDSESITRLQSVLTSQQSLGYRIAATASAIDAGLWSLLTAKKESGYLDEIVAVGERWSKNDIIALADMATLLHVDFSYSADKIGIGRLQSVMIAGMPYVEVRRTLLSGWWRIGKRCFDCVGSAIALIVFAPIMTIIALIIASTSRGPIIYKDIRVGQHSVFQTYKFRTMYIDMCTGPEYDETGSAEKLEEQLIATCNERNGPVPKVLHDPRRTPFGRFLEATSLDELPQFVNVFIGTMSLVGPRPHRPKEVAGYDIKDHRLFSVKPGITGLAQISGRSDLDFSEEVKLDLYYIENWSLKLDLIILMKTPLAVLMRKSRV